jgi:acyl-CoA synthetase (AMP-forming)/AMP-acid ligase II
MTELGWEFVQIYGLTETTPLLTMNRTRAEWDDLAPVPSRRSSSTAPGAGGRLHDGGQRDGEVLARGNMVMEGYWEQPDATAAAIHDGFFHTGDGGSIDEANYVTIADRKKDVIISGGENVSSIEVEDAIFQHPDVTEVAVIGIPDEKWGELVTALVVTTPGLELTEADVIAWTKQKLAGYKCPKKVEFRTSSPAPPPASSRSSSSAPRSGRAASARSTDGSLERGVVGARSSVVVPRTTSATLGEVGAVVVDHAGVRVAHGRVQRVGRSLTVVEPTAGRAARRRARTRRPGSAPRASPDRTPSRRGGSRRRRAPGRRRSRRCRRASRRRSRASAR